MWKSQRQVITRYSKMRHECEILVGDWFQINAIVILSFL